MTAEPEATRMFREAAEAPSAVARLLEANAPLCDALGARLRALAPRTVVTFARGSSDNAATYAKYLIEITTGATTSSAAMSVSSVYAANPVLDGVPVLAISQSGRSPDLLAAVASARRAGAWVLALVNDERSPLAAVAGDVLPLHAGPETSVAATKSFIAAQAAVAQLVAAWTEDAALAAALGRLPADLQAAWDADIPPIAQAWREAVSLFVLGRGVGYAAAQEAALKLKETCGLHAEAFSAAEVAHGPMALVGSGFPILAFVQGDASEAGVLERLDELRARGADIFRLGGPARVIGGGPPRTHPMLEPICQVLNFYRAANALALARGRDPDRPPHLGKVTETL